MSRQGPQGNDEKPQIMIITIKKAQKQNNKQSDKQEPEMF